MDQRWNLDRIYKSFDCDEFRDDLQALGKDVNELLLWVRENFNSTTNACRKLEEYINKLSNINNKYTKLYYYSFLALSLDSGSEEAGKYLYITDTRYNEITDAVVRFRRWLGSLDNIEEAITQSPLLEAYRLYILEAMEKSCYLLSDEVESVISKLKNSGSDAWTALRNALISRVMVDVALEGEKKSLPLPVVVMNLSGDRNPEVRRAVHQGKLAACSGIETSIAACLNGIKGEATALSKLRGYSSVLDKTLRDYRLSENILETMLKELDNSLPVLRRFYVKKGELLGVSGKLPIYDTNAPVENSGIKFSYEDMMEYIIVRYRSYSEHLGEFAKRAFLEGWIDSEPRQGRNGYGFNYNIDAIGESRILMNFDGGIGNITTLSHELGHAYHFSRLSRQGILNREYTPPISETASLFFEAIVKNAAIYEAKGHGKRALLDASLTDTMSLLFETYSAFLFESRLFEIREDHPLSVDELKALSIEVQKKVYGDCIEEDTLNPYIWLFKPHLYSAEYNFYNFPYIFGLLLAKGLYSRYLISKDEFVEKFDRMLEFSGSADILELGKFMGIDLTSGEFWKESLKVIEDEIKEYISL